MGESFLSKQITAPLIEQLEEIGIDACGENGEYHTLVANMPLFKNRLGVSFGEPVLHNGYWFTSMKLNQPVL